MSIHVGLNHYTHYQFDRMIEVGPHLLRLRPAPHCRTPVLSYSLRISPERYFINWQQDPFGNYLARLVFPEPTDHISFEVDLIADLTVINPFDFFLEQNAEAYPLRYDESLARDLMPYLEIDERGPLLSTWLAGVDRTPIATVDFLVALNRRLQQEIGYVVRLEPGIQRCEETLGRRLGSCRDSAWLMVQILRHLGIAARFVSGYLVQLTSDVKPLDGPAGPSSDFTDLHAWSEAYIPGAGWIGLDPTSGLLAGEGHIPLACTPQPSNAAPITGTTEACHSKLTYRNQVRRAHEDPRVTKPYSDEQWRQIDALGEQVDADLIAGDVRLTMGGEPTFVAVDDPDAPEWNTAASGPTKRLLSGRLLRALWKRFGPNGVVHYGQGKWYPGEILPRWALACIWRHDGQPLWRDPTLLADENDHSDRDLEDAWRFASILAGHLGLWDELVVPGYEDALYYIWKEGTLPNNVDPLTCGVDDPEERRRLSAVLSRGLSRASGFALPLQWIPQGPTGKWHSGRWDLRRGRMYLLPGSSPMGYRLPTESLPWVPPEKRPFEPPPSPFAPVGELRSRAALDRHPTSWVMQSPVDTPRTAGDRRRSTGGTPIFDGGIAPRTALCVEAREGRLYVFLPPLLYVEAYIDLLAAIEATAAELGIAIILEGYEPPRDPRLPRFQITPDPGVIEVNIHPASSWTELSHNTGVLYEEAHRCRLTTEKFMLDGRHTGTGGGNHITLGGLTPNDSPCLRRPDLLRSLLSYWHNHPSLSYLFAGLFVGPTSQAPRVDEARDDSLYELEIAFQQVPAGEVPQAWLVDRLFRHLLVDVTGNTHRTEFCIDKLHSPDSIAGRSGLIEMRAFEMPPHPRMSLVQQLLLRALIARFWRTPYRRPLLRWGTALHDRFLLPHFLWEDARDVVCGLERAGYAFELDWLRPFLELRFPRCGTFHAGDISVELRMAIEPWHVLGEEVAAQGTARYVDSSLERLQVKTSGLAIGRHVVTCNGRRVPLHSTGRPGEAVAGVRYRAWQPSSALHPTIAVHTPLVFDIVDMWNETSLGGCTYHVAHPGGRNYERFPVNAAEAEARRAARFWPLGHTPGKMSPAIEEPSAEFPYTLDLRRHDRCA